MDNRGRFEEEWRNAMEGGTIQPSEMLWDSINANLDGMDKEEYKRKFIFFRWVAAASIFLAVSAIAYSSFTLNAFKEELATLKLNQYPSMESPNTLAQGQNVNTKNNSTSTTSENNGESSGGENQNSAFNSISENDRKETARIGNLSEDNNLFTQKSRKSAVPPLNDEEYITENSLANRERETDHLVNNAPQLLAKNTEESIEDNAIVSNQLTHSKEPFIPKSFAKSLVLNSDYGNTLPLSNVYALNQSENTTSEEYYQGNDSHENTSDHLERISDRIASNRKNNQDLNEIASIGIDFSDEFEVPEMITYPVMNITFDTEKSRPFYAGINFGSGSYNPNGVGGSSVMMETNTFADLASNSNRSGSYEGMEESGAFVNLGLDVGKRISKKLVLQSGLKYAELNSSFTETDVTFSQNTTTNVAVYESVTMAKERSQKFISVPMKLGYYIKDSRFNFLLSSGIISNVFIQSVIKPQIGEVYADSNTGYAPFNFWGNISTELSYAIDEHYNIGVYPGLLVAINDPQGGNNHPGIFEVGFNLRYTFGD